VSAETGIAPAVGAAGATGLPLRVALFAEQGHPSGSFRSGVTRLTDRIVKGCAERRVPLDFYTYHERAGSDLVGSIRYVRVEPRVAAEFHGLRVDALDILPFMNPRLDRAAEGYPYDVVVSTSPGIGTQGQLLARRLGIPFVALHTTDLPHYASALVHDLMGTLPGARAVAELARWGARSYLHWLYDRERTDLVLVPTHAARRDLLAHVHARVEVLGRGADTLSFPHFDRPRRAVARLLYVGRIDYGQKNLAVLERLLRELDEVELWAVGGGDDLTLMHQRLADFIGAGRVHLTGRIDDAERLRSIYESADVFVFPSIYDTLGQVVIEAQRAGLPVVVSDRGGPAELVRHAESGFVTEDADAFVRRVRELAGDPGLRARMGRAAKAHADALTTWDDVIARLLDGLERLVRPESITAGRPGARGAHALRH
jgi:glycosyltransferase involved in cell wall biosynthesis